MRWIRLAFFGCLVVCAAVSEINTFWKLSSFREGPAGREKVSCCYSSLVFLLCYYWSLHYLAIDEEEKKGPEMPKISFFFSCEASDVCGKLFSGSKMKNSSNCYMITFLVNIDDPFIAHRELMLNFHVCLTLFSNFINIWFCLKVDRTTRYAYQPYQHHSLNFENIQSCSLFFSLKRDLLIEEVNLRVFHDKEVFYFDVRARIFRQQTSNLLCRYRAREK